MVRRLTDEPFGGADPETLTGGASNQLDSYDPALAAERLADRILSTSQAELATRAEEAARRHSAGRARQLRSGPTSNQQSTWRGLDRSDG